MPLPSQIPLPLQGRSRDRHRQSVQSVHPAFPYISPSIRFRSTEQATENHGAHIALCLNASYRTESFVFFTVRVGANHKTGLQIDLKAHLLSSGNFFASLFYGEDDPEALTLNYVNAGSNGP